jgi:hypothetical protein
MGSKLGDALIITGFFGFMAIMGLVVYVRFEPDIHRAIDMIQKGNFLQFQGAFKDNPFVGSNTTNTNPFESRAVYSLADEEERPKPWALRRY